MATISEFVSKVFVQSPRGFAPQSKAQDVKQSTGLSGFLSGGRLSGGNIIIPQVTITENHNDQVVTTDHPVESGAYKNGMITDHAYVMPATVKIQFGWSRSPTLDLLNLQNFNVANIKTIYERLLRLKNDRILLRVYTGKRLYNNMLIVSLSTISDQKHENDLIVDCDFKEIVFATTLATPQTFDNSTFPQNSTAPQNNGSIPLQDARPPNTGANGPMNWFA